MKKRKYDIGGLTALKDKIQGANPFPDFTKNERDAVMEAYTQGVIKEDGGLIDDVPPMKVGNIPFWLNNYSKYIPKEPIKFSNLVTISRFDLKSLMSRVNRKYEQLRGILRNAPKVKSENDIRNSPLMESGLYGSKGNWEGEVKDGFQVYNNEQQYIMESTIKDFARVLNNLSVWKEGTDEYKDLEKFVKDYNIFLEHIKENPQSKEAEFLKEKEEPKEEPKEQEPQEEPKEQEPFVPRVERSGKWDESYSVLCDELATYEKGGSIESNPKIYEWAEYLNREQLPCLWQPNMFQYKFLVDLNLMMELLREIDTNFCIDTNPNNFAYTKEEGGEICLFDIEDVQDGKGAWELIEAEYSNIEPFDNPIDNDNYEILGIGEASQGGVFLDKRDGSVLKLTASPFEVLGTHKVMEAQKRSDDYLVNFPKIYGIKNVGKLNLVKDVHTKYPSPNNYFAIRRADIVPFEDDRRLSEKLAFPTNPNTYYIDCMITTICQYYIIVEDKNGYWGELLINNDIEKPIEVLGEVLKNPNKYIRSSFEDGGKLEAKGDCYFASGNLVMRDFLKAIDYVGTPYLVHAEVQGQGALSNIRYGHSWIEDDFMVYDYSNNRKLAIDKNLYYGLGDVKTDNPKKYQKYTFDEARRKMLESGHYGCWDLDVEYEEGGKVMDVETKEEGGIISGKKLKKYIENSNYGSDLSFVEYINDNDNFDLKNIDINVQIQKDGTLKDYVNNSEDFKPNEKESEWLNKTPIIIGDNSYETDVVLDGYHRIKQAKANKEKTILAYVKASNYNTSNMRAKGGNIPMNIKFFDSKGKQKGETKDEIKRVSYGKDPFADTRVREQTLDEIKAEMRKDGWSYELADEFGEGVYARQGMSEEEKALYMGFKDLADLERFNREQDAEMEAYEKNFKENFYKDYDGFEVNSLDFEGVVAIDGKNQKIIRAFDGKVFKPSKAKLKALQKELFSDYKKGGNIPMNIKFFDSKGKVKQEKEMVEKITFGKDPFADTRVREKTLDEIREEMLRSDSQITRELAYETAPFVYGLQGLNDEEVARYMGYEDVAEQKREEQKQDAEWEETRKNFKEYFYKEYNGMQVNSVEFAGVVDIDGKNKTIKRIYDEKVFRPSKAKLKALEQEIFDENFKKGGYVSWKDKYNKKYGYEKGKSHSLKEVSKDTKVSMKGLQKIYDKGVGARKTNPQSVRSVSDGKKRGGKSLKGKMSAEQWAMARVYSAVMGGKASKVDAKELKMAKGGDIKFDVLEMARQFDVVDSDGTKYEGEVIKPLSKSEKNKIIKAIKNIAENVDGRFSDIVVDDFTNEEIYINLIFDNDVYVNSPQDIILYRKTFELNNSDESYIDHRYLYESGYEYAKGGNINNGFYDYANGGDVKMDVMSDGSFNYGLLNKKYLKSLTNEKRLSLLTNLSEMGYIIPYKDFIKMSNQEALKQVEQVITEQRDNQIPIYDYMYSDSDNFRDSVERDYELANPNYILYKYEVDKWFERENPQQFLDEGYLNDWQFTNDIRQDYIKIAESPRVVYYVIPYILDENNPKDDGFMDYIAIHKPSQRWGFFETDYDFNPLQIEKENGVLSFTDFETNYAKGGSIKRNANSPLLKYVNFEDGWSINLKKLNLYTNQNGKKYKSKNKYGISRQGGKDKDIWEFETLNEAKIKFDELVELGKTYSKIENQGDVNKNYAKGGDINNGFYDYAKGGSMPSKSSCYKKQTKYKDGGMIFTFDEGGEISDTCYVKYAGYQIQNTRCKDEGIDFFLVGEYREVAQMLRENYPSEWIYYNRLSRLFVKPSTAKEFVREASNHFNPKVPIEPYFLEVDRSFATYINTLSIPFEDVPISTSIGRSEKPKIDLKDKIKSRKEDKERQEQEERMLEQEKPFFKTEDFVRSNGVYWAIALVVNVGGKGDFGDNLWKNSILNENIPYDNGISLMTLVHEYAHCLDYNQSISQGRVYKRPLYELELLSGRNSIGEPFTQEELKKMRLAQKQGGERSTLLSNHKEYFVKALSDILRAGMSGNISILNRIEDEAHQIEKRVGGEAYAEQQRNDAQNEFLLAMQKTIEKANKVNLGVQIPTKFKEFLKNTNSAFIVELPITEIDKKIAIQLKPHLDIYKNIVKENMGYNPSQNTKLLNELRKLEKDIKRLQERT